MSYFILENYCREQRLSLHIPQKRLIKNSKTALLTTLALCTTLLSFTGTDQTAGWQAFKYIASILIVVSCIGGMIDDKGGAAGAAISSRLGMSSNVRQAEQR